MATIMVIEDEPDIREDLRMMLEMEGYETIIAENGKIGLEKLRQTIPDMIFCDVLMPEMGGLELLETLKTQSATADIPFVFISAKSAPEDIRRGMHAGADAYLRKPFAISEILNTIDKLLD